MTNPFAQPAAPVPTPAGPVNPFANPVPAPAVPSFPGALSPQEMQTVATNSFKQATGQQTTPPALDLNRLSSAPAPIIGEGGGAKLNDMFGRLLLLFPLRLDRVPEFKSSNGQTDQNRRPSADGLRNQITATVVVLDDGNGGHSPIQWGGDIYAPPQLQKPHTDSAPLPYVRKAMWLSQSRLISQLRDSLPTTPGQAPGMIAGRLSKAGNGPTDAWYLIGATEQEVALVRTYLELVQAGQYPHPLA